MKTHFFDPKISISSIKFLTTFKPASVFNTIHEGAAVWILPNCVKDTFVGALNSGMCAKNQVAPSDASMRYEQHQSHKLLRLYPEAANYLLKKYAIDQTIIEYDAAILRYMQPANRTPQQYTDDLIAM